MAGTIIGGTYSSQFALNDPGTQNPASLTSAAVIQSGSLAALEGFGSGTAWTITNSGTIVSVSTIGNGTTLSGVGISLQGGGMITNLSGGLISGGGGTFIYGSGHYNDGIDVTGGAATVVNAGSIAGRHGVGISLTAGGSVTNQSGGSIYAEGYDIVIKGTAGTVVNQGHMSSTYTDGVVLFVGGAITNAAGATISAHSAGIDTAGAGTVVNRGFITASNGTGVLTRPAMAISNEAGGTISGNLEGVEMLQQASYSAIGTVVNDGSISGGEFSGIAILSGGLVTNGAGASVVGAYHGVYIYTTGTVTNAGVIRNRYDFNESSGLASAGVGMAKGGQVTNLAGGTIAGHNGILLTGGAGTVENAGTIGSFFFSPPGTVAGTGDAVRLASGDTDRVIADPGAVFIGTVDGGNAVGGGFVSTLELASAASQGAISSLGGQFINFGQVVVDASANWQLTGTNTLALGSVLTNQGTLKLTAANFTDSGLLVNNGVLNIDPSTLAAATLTGTGSVGIGSSSTFDAQGTVSAGQTLDFTGSGAVLQLYDPVDFAGTIDGFAPGQTIVLPGSLVINSTTLLAGNLLQINLTGGGTIDLQFDPTQVFGSASFSVNSGNRLTISCFRSGTRIATEHGPIAVEDLHIGDMVMTQRGTHEVPRPIVWLGRRTIDCRRHPRPEQVWPVRVRAGTFGDGLPARDLWLSPDHAVHVDGVLIPVKHLVNGDSVAQVEADSITYHHVELGEHAVLLADGLPVESYLDVGDRTDFANGGAGVRLYPDFSSRTWEAFACAPLYIVGPKVDAVRARLRSGARERATVRSA